MTKSQHAQAVAATAANANAGQPRGRRANLPKAKPQHSISHVKPIRNQTPASRRQATPARTVTKPRASACPNPTCTKPNVEDGVCHSCGTIVNESNIVSEVTFGENSAGGAVLQGTFVGDGKTHANTMGPAGNRIGGGDDSGGHVDALKEGTEVINGLKQAFKLDESVVTFGIQAFKYVTMANFCQGRRVTIVAVCALYASARAMKSEHYNPDWRNYQCKVMLIDFAEHLGLNVFKLGRVFKAMLERMCLLSFPVMVPEDLMYRFAVKLDFGLEITHVTKTAIKLAQRMQQDWMLTGRRPAGVCGACILMAARLHNFRRTVQEVVYIVKVTEGTIQKRLDEFKYTAASDMTVEEFLTNDPSTSEHDPPAFYQQTEEYKKTRKTRKRKRTLQHEDDDEGREGSQDREGSRSTSSSSSPSPGPASQPQLDADGFAIPALPSRKKARKRKSVLPTPPSSQITTAGAGTDEPLNPGSPAEIPIDPSLLNPNASADVADLEHLAETHGDVELPQPEPEENVVNSAPQETDADEALEQEINNIMNEPSTLQQVNEVVASHLKAHPPNREQIDIQFNDPNSEVHKQHMEIAKVQAALVSRMVAQATPEQNICDDAIVGEDEFAHDVEVLNCILCDDEVKVKSRIWYHDNKDWCIRQIEKEQQKEEEKKRPKIKRTRKKQPKMGEGQAEPMGTAEAAAVAALQRRTGRTRNGEVKSRKINYEALKNMYRKEDGSVPSSSSTSRATSVVAPRREGSAKLAAVAATRRASSRAATAESEGDPSDYVSVVESEADDVGNDLLDDEDNFLGYDDQEDIDDY